jgi:hypothetical protein
VVAKKVIHWFHQKKHGSKRIGWFQQKSKMVVAKINVIVAKKSQQQKLQ